MVDVSRQLLALAARSYGAQTLDGTWKNADNPEYLASLGKAILGESSEIVMEVGVTNPFRRLVVVADTSKVIPGGALVFFQSYAQLDRCVKRWRECGLFAEM